MGCDIHLYVEVKGEDGKWRSNDEVDVYDDRSYDLFSVLAGVRNYSQTPMIAPPRGIPEQRGRQYAYWLNAFDVDGHSHSYHTLAQLKAFDWSLKVKRSGYVNHVGFEEWQTKGRPGMYWRYSSYQELSNSEMQELVNLKGENQYPKYDTKVEWEEPVLDPDHPFLTKFMPQLEELAAKYGGPENVRIIFFFDN